KSDFQLGANPIHTGNQHWVDILRLIDRKQSAEAADLAEYASGEGFVGEVFNPLLGAVGAIDIDTGVGVSYWRTVQRIVGHACSSVSKDWGRRWCLLLKRSVPERLIVACSRVRMPGGDEKWQRVRRVGIH